MKFFANSLTHLSLVFFLLFSGGALEGSDEKIVDLSEGQVSSSPTECVADQNPYVNLSPRLTDQQVEKWRLKNGISLLLVHDPEAPQSAIGVCVPTGSADDPKHFRGTAHFTEHLVAGRSNEKFPGGINEFVLGQGGIYNASTYLGYTTYRIALGNEFFASTAERIFAMLQKPLFLEEDVKSELTPVDEEFQIHSVRDGFRIWSGILSQLNKNCPLQGYHCGNKELLSSVTGEDLKNWFEEHYSSKGSCCVFLSAKPLEEMRDIVLPLAESVPIRSSWERKEEVYVQEESKFIFVETLQGTNCLIFVWPYMESCQAEKQHNLYLLSHLVGSEYPNGLSFTLKDLGFAEGCSAEIETLGRGLPNLFVLEVKLTDLGTKQWREVAAQVETFLEQAALLSKDDSNRIIEELRQSQILNYQYRGKLDPFGFVSQNSLALMKEPIETFPFYTIAPHSFEWESYKAACKDLLLSKKIVLLGGNFAKWVLAEDNLPGKPTEESQLDKMDLWGYNFFACTLPNLGRSNTEFSFPPKQRFLPVGTPNPHFIGFGNMTEVNPQIQFGFQSGPIYLIQDDYFGIPKDHLLVQLKHPFFFIKNPTWHLMAEMWGRIVSKELDTLSYEAGIAGNGLTIGKKSPSSVELCFSAWEGASERVIQESLNGVQSTAISKETFERVLQEMKLEIMEIESAPPFQTARRLFLEQINPLIPTLEERKLFLSSIDCASIQEFKDFFLREASFEAVYLGQKNREQLEDLLKPIEKVFAANYTQEMAVDIFHPGLAQGLQEAHFSSDLPGHAARLSVDCGSNRDPMAFVCGWILASGMDSIAMDQLREKEELGYVVRCGLQEAYGRVFFTIITQSTKVDSRYLLERYRRLFKDVIANLGEDPYFHRVKFDALRSACSELLTAPEGSPLELLGKVASIAFERGKKWSFEREAIETVNKLTFQEFKEFCNNVFGEETSCQFLVAVEGPLAQATPSREVLSQAHS
ncbi:insulinase family protein [Candidatus Similichlamydia epinepheli]|uniref:insulinase family protein n=1 Tax=Candidatus Similichlamydia epinepheli TaxID=1903953 RepID=UPI000D350AA8|nr:insulinase family protein [Candidatus Similichlamydia epinepheli]